MEYIAVNGIKEWEFPAFIHNAFFMHTDALEFIWL